MQNLTLNSDGDNQFDTERVFNLLATGVAVAVAAVIIYCLLPEGVLSSIITAFSSAVTSFGGLIYSLNPA